MRRTHTSSILSAVLIALAALLLLSPRAHAQSTPPTQLRSAIRSELLSDPRTSSLSQAQLNVMIDLLASAAQRQHLTAADILKQQVAQPALAAPSSEASSCSGISCLFDEALGFIGLDTRIPFMLGAASIALIWLIAEMLHRHHLHAAQNVPQNPIA